MKHQEMLAIAIEEAKKGLAEGGIVSPVIREIEVDCLPTAIPEFIEGAWFARRTGNGTGRLDGYRQ